MKKLFRIKLVLALLAGLLVADIGPAAQPAEAADGTCASNGTVAEGDSGNYHWVKFTVTTNSSGEATCTFRTPAGVSIVSVLSVSGGGGGGHDGGGGGGGGGVLYYDQMQLNENTDYSVIVGAGGAAAGSSCASGNCPEGLDGNLSKFNNNYAAGGGGGGGRYSAGNSAGTGGGAGHTNDATVLSGGTGSGYADGFSVTYGRNGGNNASTRGGGGAGAVAAGNNGGDLDAGVGGKGFASSIDGTSRVYGGGGGGGTYTGNARSIVNVGGGGTGGNNTNNGANGSDGFGGGGGGGGDSDSPAGRGGSGVVIVRYLTVATCATPTPVTDGSEVYLKFVTTSESRSCLKSWTVPTGVNSVQLLVIGGGGSGGTRRGTLGGGGGGGAGGFRSESSFSVTPGNSISILVGAGGAAQTAQQDAWGFDGNLSYFSTVITQGGGGGGAYCGGADDQTDTRSGAVTLSINGRTGGSGGGSGRCSLSTGGAAADANYGNAGGSANYSTVAGGGGGKGSAGNGGSAASNPGRGGNGATSTITGSTVTYAAGGGGSGGTAALGGSSIGGTGAREDTSAATAGSSQTGSGGGGGYASSGTGGSGVVIVRYQPSTCSPTSGNSNGYEYVSFTTVTTCKWEIPVGVSSIDLVVVGGGGGGGYDSGGGGGGGGYAEKIGLSVTSGSTFILTVGSGGAAATSSQSVGTTGSSSIFSSISATGGTGGGSCTYTGQGFNGSSCESRNIGGNRGTGTSGTTISTSTRVGGNGFCFSNSGGCSPAESKSSSGWTSSVNSQTYSIGGGGGGSADLNPTANTGSGGKGGGGNSTGSAGAGGLIVVKYQSAPLNVTFDSKGGSAVSSTTVLTSATLSAPTAPTLADYDFLGWSLTSTGSVVSFPFTHGQTADFTLYAQWRMSVPNLSSVTVTGTALSGSIITATPSATGPGPITYSYQWYRILTGLGTFQIDGATSSTYTLTDEDLLGYAYVSVIASNAGSSSSSVIGSMPANQKIGVATPTISGSMQSGQLLTGATSSSIAAGTTSAYEWLRSDSTAGTYTAINNATNSTYRLTSSDVGKYLKFKITIRNINRGVTSIASSSAATNVVVVGTPTISSQPSSATKYAGQSVTFSVTASAADSGALSYQWKKNGTDISGATDSSYLINSVASGDAGSYTVVVTNTLNGTTATATSNAAVLTFATATQLSTPNTPGTTTITGSTTSIGVTYTSVANAISHTVKVYASGVLVGTARTSFVSGTTITGLTAGTTYTVTVTAIGDGTVYTDSAESAASTITTNAAAVIPTINSQPTSATKYAGQSVDFTVNASASDSGSLSYQWKKNGTAISGAQSATLSINPISSSDAGSYTVVVTNTLNGTTASITSNTATLTFAIATQLSTPTAPTVSATSGSTTSITVSFTSVANASSHTIKVYASGVLVGTAHTSFTSGSTISDLSSNTAYTVTVTAIGDGTIYSDSAASSATSVTTNAVTVTPTISSHPSSSSKYTGQSVTFSVTATASDSGLLSYQWKVGGVSISGANSATYTIGTLAMGNSGDYTVTVTNSKNGSFASITSDIATLTVTVQTFTVVYTAPDKSSGSVPVDSVGLYVTDSTVTLLANTGGLTRGSYSFAGWRTASDPTVRTAGSTYVITSNLTFIAVWTQDQVATNTITFATISNKTYGDSFTVTVSASSGLTVTVSSSTTSVCTVSTLTVTAISVGTCTLVAAQGGNGTYPAATSVTNTFTVGKKSLVITASDQSGTVGSSTSAPSYSQSGLVTALGDAIGSVSYTYVGSGSTRYAQSSNAPASGGNWILGTYKITPASLVLSSGSASNYNISYAQGTLTVSGTSTSGISGISVKSTGLNKTTELLTGFSAATTSYGIYVESAVSSVTVVITRTSGSLANAQVSVNDSGFRRLTFTSNAANSGILALPQQSNTITLKIVATDLSVQTYTISILRDQATSSATGGVPTPTPTATPRAANQVINSVAFYVNSTSGNTSSLIEVSMNRAFDKAVSSYTVSFTNAQSVTQLRTTFTDPGITIRIKVNQGAFRTIPSTGASTSLALNEGANTAILRVASSDGTVADYTFTLNRAA